MTVIFVNNPKCQIASKNIKNIPYQLSRIKNDLNSNINKKSKIDIKIVQTILIKMNPLKSSI